MRNKNLSVGVLATLTVFSCALVPSALAETPDDLFQRLHQTIQSFRDPCGEQNYYDQHKECQSCGHEIFEKNHQKDCATAKAFDPNQCNPKEDCSNMEKMDPNSDRYKCCAVRAFTGSSSPEAQKKLDQAADGAN